MRQPESRLQYHVRQALELAVGGLWYKAHGGEFSEPGIADLVGCVQGLHVEIEVKMPTGRERKSQLLRQRRVRKEGGLYEFARSVEEAVTFVSRWLLLHDKVVKDGTVCKAALSGQLRLPSRKRRIIYVAGNGKDYYIVKRNRPLVAKTIR